MGGSKFLQHSEGKQGKQQEEQLYVCGGGVGGVVSSVDNSKETKMSGTEWARKSSDNP